MLKLNQNYSDYTDETDENYPEGKAINASTSESVDGTPLLAEFMNDINAAHIAMYEKAYGNRDGISGSADTQKASQFADAIAKYSDDKLNAHKDQRGLTDGVHGATSEATAGQIASRDEFGNLKVGTAIEEEDAVNKSTVEAMIKVVSDAVTPVGFVYTQLPGCLSPIEMKLFGTWEEVKLGGAFLRAEGGDAKLFTAPMKVINVSDKLLTVNNDDISTAASLATLKVGDLLICKDEYRTVQEINGAVIKIDNAFNNSEIITILIGQNDQFQGHYHQVDKVAPNTTWSYDAYLGAGGQQYLYWNPFTAATPVSDGKNGAPRTGSETRTKNITVRCWKRTA